MTIPTSHRCMTTHSFLFNPPSDDIVCYFAFYLGGTPLWFLPNPVTPRCHTAICAPFPRRTSPPPPLVFAFFFRTPTNLSIETHSLATVLPPSICFTVSSFFFFSESGLLSETVQWAPFLPPSNSVNGPVFLLRPLAEGLYRLYTNRPVFSLSTAQFLYRYF